MEIGPNNNISKVPIEFLNKINIQIPALSATAMEFERLCSTHHYLFIGGDTITKKGTTKKKKNNRQNPSPQSL